jgi:hypothetical protein
MENRLGLLFNPRLTAVDRRTPRVSGYSASQRLQTGAANLQPDENHWPSKKIRRPMAEWVALRFSFTVAADNLVCIFNLIDSASLEPQMGPGKTTIRR